MKQNSYSCMKHNHDVRCEVKMRPNPRAQRGSMFEETPVPKRIRDPDSAFSGYWDMTQVRRMARGHEQEEQGGCRM